MKNFRVGLLILALSLAAPARAADSAAPAFYSTTVVDDQGKPVAGATVDAYVYQRSEGWGYRDREPEHTQRTVTGSNGVFALLPSPGATLAVVKKAGLATAWKTWSPYLEDSPDPVVLTVPTSLAGIVLDENNQPVAGAEVWVTDAIIGNIYGREEQENELFRQPARECFSTRTEADGRFRIPNFPAAGHAGLAVKAAGKALRPSGEYAMSRDHQSGDDDIQLRVAPAGAVEGKVAVEDTGQPLAGVKIKLEPGKGGLCGSDYREPIESGEDGSFRIPDVQPGDYNVRAVIPGQPVPDWVLSVVKPENRQVTVVAGETARGLEIQASKGALVQVMVVMTNDLTPVVGVPVSAAGATVYTGINGMALFRVPLGRNYFSTRKDWISQHREADVEAGHITNVWIELLPPPTITGTVRDPSGAPVPGALVSFHPGLYSLLKYPIERRVGARGLHYFLGNHGSCRPGALTGRVFQQAVYPSMPDYSEVTTDKDGRYEIILRLSREDMAWHGMIYETNFLLARSVERNLTAIQEFVKIPATLDLDLQLGVTITGSVKDPAGAPVTNAAVDLALERFRSSRQTGPPLIKVNAQGVFSLPAMPQGGNYWSSEGVTAKGYGTAGLILKPEDTKTNHYEFPPIVLKRADRKLAGQVLGLDGKPVSGATVRFNGDGQPRLRWLGPETKTDSQGHFAFDAVCEGLVTVSANSGNTQGNVPANGGDTNVVIRLGINLVTYGQNPNPPRKITGTVRDPSGTPSPAVTMSLFPVQGSAIDNESDSAGHYEFNWQTNPALQETNWLLARDLKRGLFALHQVDKTTTNLDLTLQEGLTISTTVQDIAGLPITNATANVTIWADPRRGYLLNPQPMIRNAHGQFLLKALPRGLRYYLHIQSPGYSFANLQAEAEDTKTNLLEMPPSILGRTNLVLAGRVLSVLGTPASSVQVELMDRFRGNLSDTLADEDGHFRFEGLAPGPVIAVVGRVNPGSARFVGGSANVMAGDTNVVVQLRLYTNTDAAASSVAVTVSGTVFDPSGAPAPGVLLSSSLVPASKPPAQSDATGKYTFQKRVLSPFERGQNMKALLFATDPKHDWIAAAELDDATTDVDLHLKQALTLSGAVRDPAGNPVTNANVLLTLFPPEAAPTWTRPPATNSDAQGRFSFTTLPPGWHCELRAYAEDYGCNTISIPAAAARTNRLQSPPIVLKPANRPLAGQVIGLDGKPCWGAEVKFTGEGQPTYRTARTDTTGNFLFKAVCEGPVQLQAELSVDEVPMFAGETRANGGDTNILIKLGATNGLPASVPTRGGQPAANPPPPSAPQQP